MGSPTKLVAGELLARFERYASPDTQMLNAMGWRYFLLSCLGLDLSDESSRALYERHANDAA